LKFIRDVQQIIAHRELLLCGPSFFFVGGKHSALLGAVSRSYSPTASWLCHAISAAFPAGCLSLGLDLKSPDIGILVE
jgi:hypothetical protein